MFLRKITDPQYAATTSFLHDTNPDLMTCVTAMRKAERDLFKRNMKVVSSDNQLDKWRKTTHNLPGKRRHIKDDMFSSDDEHLTKRIKSRRVQGEASDTTEKGLISVPSNKWFGLPEEHQTFVQTCNAKVKHNESVKELNTPDGFIFQNKARWVDMVEPMEEIIEVQKDKTSEKNKTVSNLSNAQQRFLFGLWLSEFCSSSSLLLSSSWHNRQPSKFLIVVFNLWKSTIRLPCTTDSGSDSGSDSCSDSGLDSDFGLSMNTQQVLS
jgi:hypothetical protein